MSVGLERRLANLRAARGADHLATERAHRRTEASGAAAARLARGVGGEAILDGDGAFVLVESGAAEIPVDRDHLARLPGHPPPDAPLLCLDTETTGLATAAGTLAFLVGLGWWDGDRFRQVQLLLPDHADEPAFLRALTGYFNRAPWLVSYNGRGFDWPLLVTRYRMDGRPAPDLAGHLDLLPVVRRVFRHRLPDARLRSVEEHLLDVHRVGDVEGWEIPGRYFDVLRGNDPALLWDVLRHNEEDVRSLARLTAAMAGRLGDPAARPSAHPGDLAGLARAFRLEARFDEALACLELALEAPLPGDPSPAPKATREVPWWNDRAADLPFGLTRPKGLGPASPVLPWTEERMLIERAHLLRRLGRHGEAADAWTAIGAGPGRVAAMAWAEASKIRERWLGDLGGALEAAERGAAALARRHRLGWPDPRLEELARRRVERLRRRAARQALALERASRSAIAADVGTPASPGASTTSEAAVAASRNAPVRPRPSGLPRRSMAAR